MSKTTVPTMNPKDIVVEDQARKDFGDITGLAASIDRVGMLSPVGVRKNGKGVVLVYGERRLRAALQLGLTEVPVVYVDKEHGAEAQVTENLQRKDLTQLEEAQAVLQLAEAGLKVGEISKATGIKGKEQTHLKRVAKAVNESLDDDALLAANQMTLQAVEEVLNLSDDDAIRSAIVTSVVNDNMTPRGVMAELKRAAAREQWETQLVPQIAELREAGIRELETKDGYMGGPKVGPQAKILSTDQAQQHTGEKCFAFYVIEPTDGYGYGSSTGELRYYCTNWLNHADETASTKPGKSEIKVESATKEKRRQYQQRQESARQRRTSVIEREARRQFLTAKRSAKDIADWAFEVALRTSSSEWDSIRKILGVDPITHTSSSGYVTKDHEGAVRAYCTEAKLDVHRVVIAYHIQQGTWFGTHMVRDENEAVRTELEELHDQVTPVVYDQFGEKYPELASDERPVTFKQRRLDEKKKAKKAKS